MDSSQGLLLDFLHPLRVIGTGRVGVQLLDFAVVPLDGIETAGERAHIVMVHALFADYHLFLLRVVENGIPGESCDSHENHEDKSCYELLSPLGGVLVVELLQKAFHLRLFVRHVLFEEGFQFGEILFEVVDLYHKDFR